MYGGKNMEKRKYEVPEIEVLESYVNEVLADLDSKDTDVEDEW